MLMHVWTLQSMYNLLVYTDCPEVLVCRQVRNGHIPSSCVQSMNIRVHIITVIQDWVIYIYVYNVQHTDLDGKQNDTKESNYEVLGSTPYECEMILVYNTKEALLLIRCGRGLRIEHAETMRGPSRSC